MILLSSNPNIGDAVLAMPTVKWIADQGAPVYFRSNCAQHDQLFQHPNLRPIDEAPPGEHDSYCLAIRQIIDKHPSAMVLEEFLGHDSIHMWPAGVPTTPWLQANPALQVPIYDFLLAPHTKDMGLRGWTWAGWRGVVAGLQTAYPGASIGVLGAQSDLDLSSIGILGVEQQYGRDLGEVMAMMQRTRRAVITVDSAPSRIAHGLGLTNHVLICADCVPQNWGSWPGAHTLYGKIKDFTADHVLAVVRSCT